MSCDLEVDLEDLEVHLYGQVHHSQNVDEVDTNISMDSAKPWHISTYNLDKTGKKSTGNYYNDNQVNIQILSQRSNEHNIHQFTVPQFLVSPVSNIVVIPPSTQMIANTRPQLSKRKRIRQMRQKLKRPKREAKKIKFLCEHLNDYEKKIFLRSYLNKTVHKQYIDQLKRILLQQKTVKNFDEIFMGENVNNTESEKSTNILNKQNCDEFSTVILSSDDETEKEKTSKVFDKIKVETKTESSIDTIILKKDDDDVIFIEPKPVEVIEIDTDNNSAQTNDHQLEEENEPISDTNVSSTSNDLQSLIIQTQSEQHIVTTKERLELLSTPDSNDFIENSSFLDPSNFNFELHGSDFGSKDCSKTKPHATSEVCETESSCSDVSMPLKFVVFNEVEFESPVKDIFSETNLESFGEYITPKRNILDKQKANIELPDTSNSNKDANAATSKHISTKDSSDSSSESDYDTNTINKISEQGLPHLTPIILDEIEFNGEDNDKGNDAVDCSSKSENKRKSENHESDCINQTTKKKLKKKRKKNKVVLEKNKETIEDVEAKGLDNNCVVERMVLSSNNKIQCIDSSSDDNDVDIELANVQEKNVANKKDDKDKNVPKKGFAAFWTSNKKKFYGESWGQENLNVVEMQKSMSDDPGLWEILDSDKQINLRSRGVRCNRCRQYGHKAFKCKNKPVIPKCSLCGTRGHAEPRCPNKMCTQCGQYGNYYTTFCSKCAQFRYHTCRTCKMQGHIEERCPDLWRRYYLTTKDGPLVKPNSPEMKPRNELCCSGCASFGHLEYECTNYYNRAHPPVNPKIHSYDDLYQKSDVQKKKQNVPSHGSGVNNNNVQQIQSIAKIHKKDHDYAKFLKNLYHDNLRTSRRGLPRHIKEVQHNYPENHILEQSMQPQMWQNTMPINYQNAIPPLLPPIVPYNADNNNPIFQSTPSNTMPVVQNQNIQVNCNSIFPTKYANFVSPAEDFYFNTPRILRRSHTMLEELCDKMDLLHSCRNDHPNLVFVHIRKLEKEIKLASNLQHKLQLRTQIDELYEKLNIILFGIYCLKDGERYVRYLNDNLIRLLQCRIHQNNDIQNLHASYQYIFSRKPKNEDYNYLVKFTSTAQAKLFSQPLYNSICEIIKQKYDYFLRMSEKYPFASNEFQGIHYLYENINDSSIYTFRDVKNFCSLYNTFVLNIKHFF